MWSSARSAAVRQLRVARAAKVNTGLSGSSRVAHQPASFIVPTAYRLVLPIRSFTESSDALAAATDATAATPRASRSASPGAKNPRAKKAAPKKKKPAAKKAKKPAAKKKKQPAPKKKRVKKEINPETKRKREIRELKPLALLDEPKKKLPDQPWLLYVARHTAGTDGGIEVLQEKVKALSPGYSSLGSSEREQLETEANQNRLANEAAYKAWVESHSVAEVDDANKARRKLKLISPLHKKLQQIKDDRAPKRAMTPYLMFTKSRWNSGEFAGEPFGPSAKRIADQWKALSDAEKKTFEQSAAEDYERYVREVESVLGRKVRTPTTQAAL